MKAKEIEKVIGVVSVETGCDCEILKCTKGTIFLKYKTIDSDKMFMFLEKLKNYFNIKGVNYSRNYNNCKNVLIKIEK